MASRHPARPICSSADLTEHGVHHFSVRYGGSQRAAMLIRFEGIAYAYLNRCVHMPKPLDCEDCRVFDETGRYLQCSMHGICYEPTTGQCLSEICAGQRLTPLRVVEQDGTILLSDKRAELPA